MSFDLSGEDPRMIVETYSTYYEKMSRKTETYAEWYKAAEQPQMTDEEFHNADDYAVMLDGFSERFAGARVQ